VLRVACSVLSQHGMCDTHIGGRSRPANHACQPHFAHRARSHRLGGAPGGTVLDIGRPRGRELRALCGMEPESGFALTHFKHETSQVRCAMLQSSLHGLSNSRWWCRVWRFLKAAIDNRLRCHSSQMRLLQQAGALADDETLHDLRAMTYAERERPEVGNDGFAEDPG